MADSLIYATAQVHGALVWTQDDDFQSLPDVRYFTKTR
jgi:predicted nucleic acid-binding protein